MARHVRMYQAFGSRPRDVRTMSGNVWELARVVYDRHERERAEARDGRMTAAMREQQARRDGYRPAA